jgi:hypothetical protein
VSMVNFMGANPLRHHVDGAPHQPGDLVEIVDAVDVDVHDVTPFVGMVGVVEYLEYECGSGQRFPDDPMIGVRFLDGRGEEFWSNELSAATPKNGA